MEQIAAADKKEGAKKDKKPSKDQERTGQKRRQI